MRSIVPAAAAVAALLTAAPAQAAPVSTEYTSVGESVYVVPPAVHEVQVALTGGRGGIKPGWALPGRGATVSGTVAVEPGSSLYAEVGGHGTDITGAAGSAAVPGGANGGGAGSTGGGGASDIRTAPAAAPGSPLKRLAVAGGGGGIGYHIDDARPGGGDAGAPGIDPSGGNAGGRPGTQSAGGAGGTTTNGVPGASGSLGAGGDAPPFNFRGGGGGGGYYGGGSGASMGACGICNLNGGGGGGSSRVPAGGTFGLAALTDPARVRISYERSTLSASSTRVDFPATRPGAISASHTIELANTSAANDVIFSGVTLASEEFIAGASSTCSGTLAAGARCKLSLRFAPPADGSFSAKLKVTSNADPLEIALTGEGVTPAQPAAAIAPAAPKAVAPVKRARIACKRNRCSVAFSSGALKVTANGTRVRATLTRNGRTYARADRIAKRGPLKLILSARRTINPGSYTLVLEHGKLRVTFPASVAEDAPPATKLAAGEARSAGQRSDSAHRVRRALLDAAVTGLRKIA